MSMDISLRDVTVTIPSKTGQTSVLFRIKKFDIPFGSRIIIEGASGLGKSTLLHLMAGLFQPESGSVQIGPHALHEMGDGERSRMRRENFSLVFQKLNLLEHLTALENVQLGALNSLGAGSSAEAKDIEVVRAALGRVGLGDRADDRIGLMSLGEQQRVAVARVLFAKPKIVLADEPTSSLDAKNAEVVIDRLLDVSKESTVVVVSHDQRIRSRFANILHFKDLIS